MSRSLLIPLAQFAAASVYLFVIITAEPPTRVWVIPMIIGGLWMLLSGALLIRRLLKFNG